MQHAAFSTARLIAASFSTSIKGLNEASPPLSTFRPALQSLTPVLLSLINMAVMSLFVSILVFLPLIQAEPVPGKFHDDKPTSQYRKVFVADVS